MLTSHRLLPQYRNTLGRHDVSTLLDKRYSGLFLPAPLAEYLNSDSRVMLVGKETKKWCGEFNDFVKARESDSLDTYIAAGAKAYERFRRYRPGKSQYGQMLRRTEKHLDLAPYSVHWANLYACSFDRGSPIGRPREELDVLERLSIELLGHQAAMLRPRVMFFVTGHGYDRVVKMFCSEHLGGHQETVYLAPKKLWAFMSNGVLCVRTSHPRYVADLRWRARALDLIKGHLAESFD